MNKEKEIVAVVGLGYVGLPLAILAEQKGYQVLGLDTDDEKVSSLTKNISPILNEKISADLLMVENIKFTTDLSVLAEAGIVIVCVPTPVYENYLPNLEPVEGACRAVAENLKPGQLIIIESTINPGVCEEVVLPILEKGSGLKVGVDFYLAHCPERINPGDKRWTLENIPRVVGSLDEVGLARSVEFYSSIITAPIKAMGSIREAEAVKIVENSFRDINIAFVNELAMSFSRLGIDVVNVINGAATKPFAFMAHYPSCGVGGHCIPVDPYYLIKYAEGKGYSHEFLKLARSINNGMPGFTIDRLSSALLEIDLPLAGTRIAVLGVAYKPDIDDCRESPAVKIIEQLKTAGAEVVVFDPFVPDRSTVTSVEQAVEGAAGVIIATGHSVFRKLAPEFFIGNRVKVLVDGVNCLDKALFESSSLIYKGIGR